MRTLIILAFIFISVSIYGQNNINWDSTYIETIGSIKYVVWEIENERADTMYIKTVITDTSEVMPIIRSDRNNYYYMYLRDSIKMSQNKIKYDAKVEQLNLIK